jgi:hypothetical protein
MNELLATLNNPWALGAIIFLSIVSSVYLWIGLKQKEIWKVIVAVGVGLPSYSITNWKMWGAGCVVCGLGLWFRTYLDSV